jgi:endo-1,3-1,4-beta-glycanase ExoK
VFATDFKALDLSPWVVSNWGAPQNGKFSPANVEMVNGVLRLKLTQAKNLDGSIVSVGAELQYKQLCGFGTYEWVVRMGSTSSTPDGDGAARSGGVSGLFPYINNSETEIDFEVEGCRPVTLELTNWKTTTAKQASSTTVLGMDRGFRRYRMVWTATKIDWFVDDVQVASHTTNVPQTPAYPMINHWGTNNPLFGGSATPGVDRFMFVKNFSFIPL